MGGSKTPNLWPVALKSRDQVTVKYQGKHGEDRD